MKIRGDENTAIIKYLEGKHAHSDTAEILRNAATRLHSVEVDASMGQHPYPAMGLTFEKNFFAHVVGMQHITLRLSGNTILEQYAAPNELIGFPGWIDISPFGHSIDIDELFADSLHQSRNF